ncbi:MAG: nucleoside-diphosphate kinase ['Candidatus Kapabacteria' thiocyanatum]|uniref:Nucleoside diphosphate kinase n=1 Tax=Candidatus Kapaibacterium thiocyanatum TaxID=1895771 RepID=A0A1M3KV37_9BACT|nr:nucleoside-diphosphate kinase ['Candidatus Kapabacteria' thiocyanatum]OJX56285.1 MAG: nucleoside-diphosphate kinase ['Candidatus Kapabacteria' thiocyanatum]
MERTLAIVKPDAVRKNNIGDILAMIQKAGFTVLACKLTRLSKEQAGEFYAVHKERPFYGELVNFMSSGPIFPIALEKNNAIADYRALIGSTDPAEAADGTIRKLYAANKGENAVHGSDSVENGINEIAFFFSDAEIIGNTK